MSTSPSAYFINSDAASLGGASPHDAWLVHGHAFAAGAPTYARALGRLRAGDLLLLWADRLGVVAAGRVLAPFDGTVHADDAWIYVPPFPDAGREYRLPVDWFLDLRHKPLATPDIRRLGIRNINPRGFLSRISNLDATLAAVEALRDAPVTAAPPRPDRQHLAAALVALKDEVHEAHRSVVAALYHLPDRTGTIGDMARALGWSVASTVNLRFGELGRRLAAAVGQDAALRRNGTPQWWNILADGRPSPHGFQWTLHPDVAGALVDAGWVDEPFTFAEELPDGRRYVEGSVTTVTVNAYERSASARAACLEAHGTDCAACSLDMGTTYGAIGVGFIHVHHLRPLAVVGEQHEVDPVRDLRPVCPNCHAMLHRKEPPMSIDELRQILDDQRRPAWRETNLRIEQVQAIVRAHANAQHLVEERPFADGGPQMLFDRLHRAAMNQAERGVATESRYGIWAMTCRDHLVAAHEATRRGDRATAESLLRAVANALTAFAAIQAALDPMRDR